MPRWIFIKGDYDLVRSPKENLFIEKAGNDVSRKRFVDIDELKHEVYNSCILYLKQTGKIQSSDFDDSLNLTATLKDIDIDNLREFVETARKKRNFPLKSNAKPEKILSHLNMFREGKIVNSALLAFATNPQHFFPTATIKCAHFHGLNVQKPIPDYKEFSGNVFLMAEQAVDFVLSKISISTGTRATSNQVDTVYEIPRAAIAEAIINAVAHRNYQSKGSIQVSVFKDRIEVLNPGKLPAELELADLKLPHGSYPHNPLLASCMFLTGAIERYGTGTLEMIRLTHEAHLNDPHFNLDEGFKVILWRLTTPINQSTDQATDQAPGKLQRRNSINSDPLSVQPSDQPADQVDELIKRLILVISRTKSRPELMKILDMRHIPNFRDNYLRPALEAGFIEMTEPDKPNTPNQKYRLTESGLKLKKKLARKTERQVID
ncbi:MAG: transcriptional regulator [Bacteroidetes bacterium]|nr:transcriptional regulator [Bacteroidota bacterium]